MICYDLLRRTLQSHAAWMAGDPSGSMANLYGHDLSGMDLTGANLAGAVLTKVNFARCHMERAVLRGAHLTHANFTDADMAKVDLTKADLRWAIGNMREVRSLQTETWAMAYTHDMLHMGCASYPIHRWWKFSDRRMAIIHPDSPGLWEVWKPIMQQIIAASPATPTGHES